MKARRVPRFGAVANCLFDERAVIVFLHLLAIVLGIMSALASSGGGLTMKFFEPSVPAALTSSSSSCPSEVVGSAPFLFLSLSDYFGGKDGVCFVKSLPNLQAGFNFDDTGALNSGTVAVTVMASLNVVVSVVLFGLAIGAWQGSLVIDASNSGGLMLAIMVPAMCSFAGALITSTGWKTTCLSLPDSNCFAPSCWEDQIYCCDLGAPCSSDSLRFNSTTLKDAYGAARSVEGYCWGAGVASLLVVFLYAAMARSGRRWATGHRPVIQRELTQLEAW